MEINNVLHQHPSAFDVKFKIIFVHSENLRYFQVRTRAKILRAQSQLVR